MKHIKIAAGLAHVSYARILDRAEDVWNEAQMVVKVKEPFPGNTIS